MFCDLALVEQDLAAWIDASCDERGCGFSDLCRKSFRVLPNRDRMQIDDAIDAFVRTSILHINEALQGAKVVSKRQATRWLDA